ncbi:S41 family peptidase [Jidongwangia harbinensis]|uniref:S41 family peptidase n=1 Tax=Jidongwangia harbinensis TaxID=2878561 RepID=UPI001CD96230|nr:S41 family peptidase [Jidongwangia harbinensis]MCA2214368.1 S41 family peptidase [Jidongwangia harbinensis]
MPTDATDTVADLSGRLVHWLHRLMPAGPRLDRLTADLTAAFATDRTPLDEAACRAVQDCAQRHSRHLELHFESASTARPDDEPAGWPPADPAAARAHGGGVTGVRRLDDGTAVVTLDALESAVVALPYVGAAFTLAAGAPRLVLDLRGNGGGDPATVAAVAGRLLGDDARHLSDVVYRDRRRQWWTPDRPDGTTFTGPVAVLVGPRTYSSAEALAYHLQARRRVTVVGEPTRGAADHVTPIRLTRQVFGILPEAYVLDAATGGNWEGTGVVPDVASPAEKALEAALQV